MKILKLAENIISSSSEHLMETYDNKVTKQLSGTLDNTINSAKKQLSEGIDLTQKEAQKMIDDIDNNFEEKAKSKLKIKLLLSKKTFDDFTSEELKILIENEKKELLSNVPMVDKIIGTYTLFS